MELALEVLFWPFVACLVITGIHTYLGLHVVSRGVIFVDLALAQIAAMGATFAFLLGYAPEGNQAYFYSLLFASLGAAIFSFLRLKEQQIPQEAIIGITFAVASATSILLADRSPQGAEFVEAMLTGALLWTPRSKILEAGFIYALVGVFHWYFRDRFLAISLDHGRAEREGWSIRWWDFLFYASFGFVITYSVSIAGVLLVFSFLIIPSVIAMLFARSIGGRLVIGWTSGTIVSMVGLSLSYGYDLPSGPAVVCMFGVALVMAATTRYVIDAEQRTMAVAKTVATAVIVAAGLWLAFVTAGRDLARAEANADAAAAVEAAAELSSASPQELARRALADLEASPDAPPPEAIETLASLGEDIHQMMSTGQISVSEQAVQALANAPDEESLGELFNEIAFHAREPWVKLRGAQQLLLRRNTLGVEAVIELLEAEPPLLLQMEAIESLREATGQDLGYDPGGDAAGKTEALQAWRAWWEANADNAFADGH